jgi:ferric-dicitrate binding protein FerR (iron transport regulator)
MRPEEEDIARLLKKSLPSARQEEQAGKRVFYRLLLAQTEKPAPSTPADDEDELHWKSRSRFSMAVSLTAAAASLLVIVILTSGLWRRAENLAHTERPGDPTRRGEYVRASDPDGRMLDLPDGSRVEMRFHSELQIDHAADGLRLRLNAGAIIVTAAKQGAGHLYVETKDAIVSVVGTIFVVSVEQPGSRVGVVDGVVNVRHGAISQKILPGQQVATNPAMERVPVEVQVSWSRRAASYLALLHQSVSPAPRAASAVPAAPPQSQPAAASQNTGEPGSLLIIGTAANGASQAGQRTGFGNARPGISLDDRGPAATTPEAERAMQQALTSREPITDLSFLAETNYFQLNRAEFFVPVTLKIAGTQLAGSESARRIFLDIVGEVIDDYGTTVQNFREAVDVRLTDKTAKELPMRQVVYDTGFTLLPGGYSIKFLVRDRVIDRMGTYQTAVVIPNLSKENKNLPISSVVLSSELINLDDALPNSMMQLRSFPVDSQLAADPLFIEGKKLIPSMTRTFSKRRDLIVFLQAYEPNTTVTQPLTAFVTLYRGPTKVFETSPLIVKDDLGRTLRTLPVRLRVPLSSLPEGTYDCQVTILDPATQKSAVWRSSINVVN